MKTLIAPALLAGLLAALILTLVQAFAVTPLIIEAEGYENAGAPEIAAPASEHHHDDATAHEHAHNPETWAPENGWQRTLSTASANLLMGAGYGLMLVALYRFRQPQNGLAGLVWGMAGYAAVFVAPAIGLPPELPGTAAAEITARQLWWTGTALATASGLALCIFPRVWALKIVGLLLIGLPHFIGAPHPAVAEALAPIELQHRFMLAAALANMVFWFALGVLSAIFFRHFSKKSSEEKSSREKTTTDIAANQA